jgi:hypothetical protein
MHTTAWPVDGLRVKISTVHLQTYLIYLNELVFKIEGSFKKNYFIYLT